jgi:hypothetical protein
LILPARIQRLRRNGRPKLDAHNRNAVGQGRNRPSIAFSERDNGVDVPYDAALVACPCPNLETGPKSSDST